MADLNDESLASLAENGWEMPDSLLAELDRRKAAAELDPSLLIPWEIVRERQGLSSEASENRQS